MNEIILYGFGGLGEKFFNYIANKNFKVVSILDKGKVGQFYSHVKVTNPEAIIIKNNPVVITILNEYVNIYEVKEPLAGICKWLDTMEIMDLNLYYMHSKA